MRIVKYLIFLIFNHYYKDGNYKKADEPYFTTTLSIIAYEMFIVYASIDFIGKYVDIEFLTLLDPLKGIVYGRGMVVFALMYPPNHYFFIKKKYFDRIYNEFKDAALNTEKNRKIGYTCLILYFPMMLAVIFNLKRWLSL